MDVIRAQEIIGVKDKVEVVLDGELVWIDSVDFDNRTARVHMENDRAELKQVKVEQLREQ